MLERRLASGPAVHYGGWSFSSRGLGVMQAPVCCMLFRARGRTVAFGFAAVRTALGARDGHAGPDARDLSRRRSRAPNVQGFEQPFGSLRRQQTPLPPASSSSFRGAMPVDNRAGQEGLEPPTV